MALLRTYYRDRYNSDKIWEVVKLNGGYYLRQYICGRQTGRGLRTTKKFHLCGFNPMACLHASYCNADEPLD